MKHGIFDSTRNCDFEDFTDYVKTNFDFPKFFEINSALVLCRRTRKKINHYKGCDDSACKGCDSGTSHADFCTVNQDCVTGNVREIHHEAYFERNLAVSHRTIKCRT